MADWDTDNAYVNTGNAYVNTSEVTEDPNSNGQPNGHHSRESSRSSGMSTSNKENQTLDRQGSMQSENSTVDNSSERELILARGSELSEESRTESAVYENYAMQQNGEMNTLTMPPKQTVIPQMSWSGGTAKERAAKSPYAPSTIDSIPEEEISIPNNANISPFTRDQLANFLRCLKVDDRIVSHLHRKNVDGKRFSRLSDTELENLGMKNPVIVYFRDKSITKQPKKKGTFIL